MFIRKIALLAMLLAGNNVFAEGMVWKVSDGNSQLYIGGTIHVLSATDYPLPEVYARAYRDSHSVVLETDLAKLQDPAALGPLMGRLMYTDGRNLKQVLSAETYAELEAFGSQRGIPIGLVTGMKPGLVMTTLTLAELQRLGLYGAGVDQYFSDKARQDNRPLIALESAEQQIEFIANMGEGREDEFVAYSLEQMEDLPGMMSSLKQAWREGDVSGLDSLVLAQLRTEFPDTYQALIVERNLNWRDQIVRMLESGETEMVLVGAAHLVGELGLPSLLAAKGYTVSRQN